jgi:hypothetical protein
MTPIEAIEVLSAMIDYDGDAEEVEALLIAIAVLATVDA